VSQRGRTCIFCGGEPLNREHLLPGWLRDVLPSGDPAVHFRQVGGDEGDRREWERRPFREKTRFVCQRCNGGWMSDLETSARPVLERPIRHARCMLTQSQQTIAATWAFKTCLVFQATQAESPIAPAAHLLDLRRSRMPPRQAAIWIGSHARSRDDPINSVFVQRPLALEHPDGRFERGGTVGYLCFLAVGALSFVVAPHRFRHRAEITYDGAFDGAIDQIWPDPSGLLTWPPRLMMDREFVEAMTLPPGGFTLRAYPA
jgi:hypothetical protein